MSALGQKQTFVDVRAMSALPPKADIRKRRQFYAEKVEAAFGSIRQLISKIRSTTCAILRSFWSVATGLRATTEARKFLRCHRR
jgi:hypothetical protein